MNQKSIPKRVFIVPYRNRLQQKFFFSNQMTFLLENQTDYEIYFVHQYDDRNFNRGATKNIGFIAMKQKYPEDYKNITFIFNDVDTLPFHKLFDYETTDGVVKHYYGFESALGGIVVMKGSDFEKINGYPNYWGWGMEDACLQKRCLKIGLQIDRSQFFPIGSPEILQLFDGVSRIVSRRDPERMKMDSGIDGLSTIHNLTYNIGYQSLNPEDNKYVVENDRIFIVNVTNFLTQIHHRNDDYHKYDLREPVRNIMFPNKNTTKFEKQVVTTEDWKNIPNHPTPNHIGFAREQQNREKTQEKIEIQKYIVQKMLLARNKLQNVKQPNTPAYIYSKEHARRAYPPPRSTPSANIGLGGVTSFRI